MASKIADMIMQYGQQGWGPKIGVNLTTPSEAEKARARLLNAQADTELAKQAELKLQKERLFTARSTSFIEDSKGNLVLDVPQYAKKVATWYPNMAQEILKGHFDTEKVRAQTDKEKAEAKLKQEEVELNKDINAARQAARTTDPDTGFIKYDEDTMIKTLNKLGRFDEARRREQDRQNLKKTTADASSATIQAGFDRASVFGRVLQSVVHSSNPQVAWDRAAKTNPDLNMGVFPGLDAVHQQYQQTLNAQDALKSEINRREFEIFKAEEAYTHSLDLAMEAQKQAYAQDNSILSSKIDASRPMFKQYFDNNNAATSILQNIEAVRNSLRGLKTDSVEGWRQGLRQFAQAVLPEKFEEIFVNTQQLRGVQHAEQLLGQLVLDSLSKLGANPTEGERDYTASILPRVAQDPKARDALLSFIEYQAKKSQASYDIATKLMNKQGHLFGNDPSTDHERAMDVWSKDNKSPLANFSDIKDSDLPEGMSMDMLKAYRKMHRDWSDDKIFRAWKELDKGNK